MTRPLSIRIRVAISWAIYMPIVALTYLTGWLDRRLRFPLPFPRDVEQLTVRKPWLLRELTTGGALPASAHIDSCEIIPMDHDTIFRSNACTITIHYTDNGEKKLLRCFAKFAPVMGTVWNRMIFNLQLNHIKEAWFNAHFANQDAAVHAPRVYCSRVSPITGHLCLVTELMTDDREYRECAYDHLDQADLDLALDGLASLHAGYWGDTSARMKYVLPIEDSTVYFFDSLVSGTWSDSARTVLVRSWTLMNRPQTILHGDSRIGNMMFPAAPGHGRYVLIDWQAARRGRAAYDLAYFLMLSLISTHRRKVEQDAIDTYHRMLVAKGVKDYSRIDLEEDYRHGCLCTLVLLSLPMLSGEASVEGLAAQIFIYGMGVWRDRMRIRMEEFDYEWMAARYDMTAPQARAAVREMIAVIDARLDTIQLSTGTTETLRDAMRRENQEYAI
jgi:hypothetical protein